MTDHEPQLKAVALRRAMLWLIVSAGARAMPAKILAEAFWNYFVREDYNHDEHTK